MSLELRGLGANGNESGVEDTEVVDLDSVPVLTDKVEDNEGKIVRDEELATRLKDMFRVADIASAKGVLEDGGEDAASLLRQADAIATLIIAGEQINKSV